MVAYEFVVRVPVTDPPPRYRNRIKAILTREVKMTLGTECDVLDLINEHVESPLPPPPLADARVIFKDDFMAVFKLVGLSVEDRVTYWQMLTEQKGENVQQR